MEFLLGEVGVIRCLILIVAALAMLASVAKADVCPGQVWAASPDPTPPNSVSNIDLAGYINQNSSWADGIKVSVEEHGDELWLDVTEFPGTTVVVAAQRVIWLAARLSAGHQKKLVFADGGEGVFEIDELIIKDIGCRFVIGQQSGENPIALLREFYDALDYYHTGLRVAPPFNGSLLGDTSTAMAVNNDIFIPKWVLSAVK